MKKIRISSLFLNLFLLCACTQEPASIQIYNTLSSDKNLKKPSVFSKYENKKQEDYRAIDVKKGDTLYELATRYDVPSLDIIEKNNLKPPYILKIGQRIKLPYAEFYTVKSGDTLSGIAKKYNAEVSRMANLNGLKEPYALNIGQKLRLPYAEEKEEKRVLFSGKPLGKSEKNGDNDNFLLGFFSKLKSLASDSDSYPYKGNSKKRSKSKAKKPEAIIKKEATSKWNGKFSWPVKGKVISRFGAKSGGLYNDGINILAPEGREIKAAADGTVVYLGDDLKGYGNLMIVRHDNGWVTAYAHQKKFNAKKGDWVKKGETIGYVGASGNVDKPQLHFAIRKGRESFDPMKFL